MAEDPIFRFKEVLTPNYTPDHLPHREKELKTISSLINGVLHNHIINIFVYGPPGTGKTASIKFIFQKLEKEANVLPVYLNCFRINTRMAALYFVFEEFFKRVKLTRRMPSRRGIGYDELFDALYSEIKNSKTKLIVCLDEVDHLLPKGSEVLYDLSRLKEECLHCQIIAISNDKSVLSDLDPRIMSSMHPVEYIHYRPYDFEEMKEIIKARVEAAFQPDVVEKEAIDFIAKYTADKGGDVRVARETLFRAGELANIMAETASGGFYASGAFSVYVELLDNLYRNNGVYDGSGNYPTIFDLLTELEERSQRSELSDRQKNWIASASKLFKSLSVGITKEAFGVKEGLNLEDILNSTVVIELDGLGDPKTKAFFIAALLQKIRNYRLQKTDRDILKHVIIIEEAQNVLAKNQEASSIITTTYREIRSLCEGIVCITQIPSELSKDALANTNTFFIMKLIHMDDKIVACNLLGINPKDMKAIEDLDSGIALMKADDICMVKVPLIKKDIVNDSDIIHDDLSNYA